MLMILLGFAIGTVGTLIGVGGGFMLIPILLHLYPTHDNVWISSVSTWVVSCNATSGSIAYLRAQRVHLNAGFVFILASLPGSIFGVWLATLVNRVTFEFVFSVGMVLYACYLLIRQNAIAPRGEFHPRSLLPKSVYLKGAVISVFVGFIASFFGIGGGLVHVPLLSHVLGFPVHLATGTSHFILAVTAWFTTAVHLYNGDIHLTEPLLWQVGGGAIVGAQLGAKLSRRVPGKNILKVLAIALLAVGIRLLLRTLPLIF